jgi:ubiquitin C-terminal hydrolase
MKGGLVNLGSTCAANSLVQMICRNSQLRNIIMTSNCQKDSFTCELKEMFDLLFFQKKSLSPKKFINSLYTEFSNFFYRGEQIDIGELWMCIHDKVCKEQGEKVYIEECKCPDFHDTENVAKYEKYIINKYNQHLNSQWCDVSQGIILNVIKCETCNNITFNFEPFISIPLDICDNTDISSMLRDYLKSSTSKGDWKCDKCNDCTQYTKKLQLWKLPKVLVFHIKRFNNHISKNTTPINIPESFQIKSNQNLVKYQLSSMALHYGNLNKGHYISICKDEQKYMLYDDINVVKIDKQCLKNNKEVYILMYNQATN